MAHAPSLPIQPERQDSWLLNRVKHRHANVAAVALANKNSRIIWALLAHDREFRVDYATQAGQHLRDKTT